jgi:hypothetical protein
MRAFIRIMYLAGPFILIIALIADYKAFFQYIDRLGNLIRQNFIFGILATIASIVFYPFVAFYLLMNAFQKRGRKNNVEWTTYEDVTDSKNS